MSIGERHHIIKLNIHNQDEVSPSLEMTTKSFNSFYLGNFISAEKAKINRAFRYIFLQSNPELVSGSVQFQRNFS